MAMNKTSSLDWATYLNLKPKYLNRNLSQKAQEALGEVSAGDEPRYYRVSWTDLYSIFQNSRRLAMESKILAASSTDGDLKAMAEVMQESHASLRGSLFLVAIENLFNIGHHNAPVVLWAYGEELELVKLVSKHIADIEEERAKVQAHFEAVFCH
jgi:hypothetical protein